MASPVKIVKFNVGGTKYEVSRSLLDRYKDCMLATICSESWSKTNQDASTEDNEIFIDRNGERFQYVLDYMRDGRVELPRSVSKSLFQADLDYYGLGFIEASIKMSFDSQSDILAGARIYRKLLEAEANELTKSWKDIVGRQIACKFAEQFFDRAVCGGPNPVFHVSVSRPTQATGVKWEPKQGVLDSNLKAFGLTITNGSYRSVSDQIHAEISQISS